MIYPDWTWLRKRSPSVIMARIVMAEPLRITFRYVGPEVENGEMDIADVVEALEGFSGAYGKVASEVSPDSSHQLRIAALDKHSFDMYIVAALTLLSQSDTIQQIQTVTNAAKVIFRIVTDIIDIIKHVQNKPYTFNFRDNGSVTILNIDKVELTVPPDSFKIFLQKLIRDDLKKITRPLRDKRIHRAELKSQDAEPKEATIEFTEKEYFQPSETTTEVEREIVGTLVSLNKDTNSGTFEFGDKKRVRYRYVGEDDVGFYRAFGGKKDTPVRVRARVSFDQDLNPLNMEMADVQQLQKELGPESHDF